MAGKKNRWWLYALIGAIVLLVVIAVVKSKLGNKLAVTTEAVTKRTITETVAASGKIAPETEVAITSAVSGEIIKLPVKDGDRVKQGQLLAEINPNLAQSAYDRATAALNNARASESASHAQLLQQQALLDAATNAYNRNQNLLDQKVISQADFDQIESNYKSAKAQCDAARENYKGASFSVVSAEASVKEARENLSRTNVYAPMDGTISKFEVEVGEQVVGTAQFSGTEMMRVANLKVMQVEVDVNESDIVKVALKDTALIDVDAYPNRKFKGIVTEIASSASNVGSATATTEVTNFKVKIRILESSYHDLIENSSKLSPFKPGMNANVEIQTTTHKGVLSIPIGAVTTRTDTLPRNGVVVYQAPDSTSGNGTQKSFTCVFLDNNGKAKLRKVKTGIQDDNYIEITQGLKEGDEVITQPYDAVSTKLANGVEINKTSQQALYKQEKK